MKLTNTNFTQELWTKAKKLIPGGNQLLSKKPEMFAPGMWPPYYSKAKGCKVWDLDGREYYDFATMGIGACSLGYADPDVDTRVVNAINNGSMSTLNSYEEVELAEKLVDLHPWSDMARFSRGGGEACAIAARIARAHTGKDVIAFCGYHGWQDWYIAANIADKKNLNQQLLSGLSSTGVPNSLSGSSIPFFYNDIDSFKEIVKNHKKDLAAVMMEPVRGSLPNDDFLSEIREITKKNNIVLIFDEVTSGFRINSGGAHLTFNIDPDMAVFGKALGNGYPISAVIGKEKIMSSAQDTFISSTFWTERVGYTAALASIEKHINKDVSSHLIKMGKLVNQGWIEAAESANLDIKISGIEPLTHIDFIYDNPALIQTLYTQEMLKRGYLVGSSVYTSFAYSDSVVEGFNKASKEVFLYLKDAIDSKNPKSFLENQIKHTGFQRLT
jgi:glutamate-1-semialdehyde aminotransferase